MSWTVGVECIVHNMPGTSATSISLLLPDVHVLKNNQIRNSRST